MKVKKIETGMPDAKDVPRLLDEAGVAYETIGTVNWAADYPYRPEAAFRIAHTADALLIHYRVTEDSVRARYGEDNGNVWTDSCVEFFSIPAGDGVYYNLECNCIGTVLLAAGRGREGREAASPEVTRLVRRWASLGDTPFEERTGTCRWELALVVPYAAFFRHRIDSLDATSVRANFYKCGDELQVPHFLSWHPIPIDRPDFHRPDHFGTLELE